MAGWQDEAEPVEAIPAGHWMEHAEPVEAAPAQERSADAAATQATTDRWDPLWAFLHGAGQGATLGFGDEVNGGIQAFGDWLGSDKSFGELYRHNRDMFRRENDAAQAAHPLAYLGGNLAGALVTAPLLSGASEAAAPGMLGSAARALGGAGGTGLASLGRLGLTLGAVQGLGDSTAPLASWETLGDMTKSGLLGAVLPAGLKGLGFVGGKAASAIGNAMDSGAIATARRVLTGGANLTNAAKKALTDDAVRQALDEGAVRPFGTTAGAAQRLNVLVKDAGGKLGDATKALIGAGVKGPVAEDLADRYAQKAAQLESVYDTGGAKVYGDFADFLRQAKPSSDIYLSPQEANRMDLQQFAEAMGLRGPNSEPPALPLDQSVQMKRSLQDETDYDKLVSKNVNKARKGLAADFRSQLVDAVRAQADAQPEAAADFEAQNARLSNLLAASKAATKGAAQASKRNAFSLYDLGVAAPILTGEVASGHGLAGAGLAAAGGLGSMVARKYGPSTLAALLYGGQAVPRAFEGLGTFALRNPNAARYLSTGALGLLPFTPAPQLSQGGE